MAGGSYRSGLRFPLDDEPEAVLDHAREQQSLRMNEAAEWLLYRQSECNGRRSGTTPLRA